MPDFHTICKVGDIPELLRAGYNERLEVDPKQLRFLFQGVSDRGRRGKPYGQIPWRLGILEPEFR